MRIKLPKPWRSVKEMMVAGHILETLIVIAAFSIFIATIFSLDKTYKANAQLSIFEHSLVQIEKGPKNADVKLNLADKTEDEILRTMKTLPLWPIINSKKVIKMSRVIEAAFRAGRETTALNLLSAMKKIIDSNIHKMIFLILAIFILTEIFLGVTYIIFIAMPMYRFIKIVDKLSGRLSDVDYGNHMEAEIFGINEADKLVESASTAITKNIDLISFSYLILNIAVESEDTEQFLNKFAVSMVTSKLFSIAWAIILDENEHLSKPFAYSNDFLSMIRMHNYDSNIRSQIKSMRNGIIITGDAADPQFIYNDAMAQKGALSAAMIPITINNKVMGFLVVASDKKIFFSEAVKKTLEHIRQLIALGINKIKLERKNNILANALKSSSEWVVITDTNGDIIYANDAVENLSGYKAIELLGKNARIFKSGIHPDKVYKELWKTITSGKQFSYTFANKGKNGENIMLDECIFPVKTKGRIKYYVSLGRDLTKQNKYEDKINYLFNYDQLTDLLNRTGFSAAIKSFIAREGYADKIAAICIINTVNFSLINYSYGYGIGDKALIEIAGRLKSYLKKYDIVGRHGADKFSVLLKNISSEEDAIVVLMNLIKTISVPLQIDGKSVNLKFTAGISFYPSDGKLPDQIVGRAEMALANVQMSGNGIGFYKRGGEQSAIKTLNLSNNLENAAKNREFVLFYQPYINIKTNKMVGAESLLRWQKGGKLILPMEFIPLLEKLDFMEDVERWIMHEVAKTVSMLKRPVTVSINISSRSFKLEHLKDTMVYEIENRSINPSFIALEIIERSIINNFYFANKLLSSLRNYGMKIYIDDFGTGFSSLSYLSKLPVDIVKIDISFIRDMVKSEKGLNLVSAIISMAQKLDIKTLAEGVETAKQLEILKRFNCDYAQGYLFAKPMSKKDFLKLE